jgi:hypothetical protein
MPKLIFGNVAGYRAGQFAEANMARIWIPVVVALGLVGCEGFGSGIVGVGGGGGGGGGQAATPILLSRR